MADAPRVALALGSGGARGYAHIGAIRVLREYGCEIVAIAGTSMGALVGGLTAAGRVEEFAAWASSLKQRDVMRLVDLRWGAPGAIAADRLLDQMSDLLVDVAIDELPIPFTAVATDLAARREVWFQRGPLRAAVRASIAIPGLFTPVMINGRLLVDGGLLNPIPVDPTTAVASDLTVAISLLGARGPLEQRSPTHDTAAPQRFEEWRGRLRRTIARLADRDPDRETDKEPDAEPGTEPDDTVAGSLAGTEALPKDLRLTQVTSMSFEAMQGLVARHRMASFPADITVEVPLDACRTIDFHRAEEMIALGADLTRSALEAAGLTPF